MYDIQHGYELIHGYNFNVEFMLDNQYVDIGFSSVSSIEDSVEYETIVEGNGHFHLVPKYISNPKTITFSKGVSSKNNEFILDQLHIGREIKEIRIEIGEPYTAIVKREKNRNIKYKAISRTILLQDCVVTKWSVANIDAMKSEVLIENFEIAYAKHYKCDFAKDMQSMFDV